MLPDVGSTIVPPGCSEPVAFGRVDHRDRDAVLDAAARDSTVSTLASSVALQALGLAETRCSRTSGVLPTRSRIESATSIARLHAGRREACRRRYPWPPPRSAPGSRRGRRLRLDRRARARAPSAVATSGGARPCSTAAACTHAPAATCSRRVGHDARAGRRGRRARAGTRPTARRRRRAASRPLGVDAGRARARRGRRADRTRRPRTRRARAASRVTSERSPAIVPVASGRFGVRSPSKYGTSVTPPAPGGAASASASSPAWSTPSSRAIASVTFVAFSVHTSGRKRPVASANPATAPVASAVGVSLTAKTVPDVPIEIATSPGRERRRRARRPCCRRYPARRSRPSERVVAPARFARAEHARAAARAQSTSSSTIASRSSAVLVRRPPRSSRCPTRRRGRSRTRPVSFQREPVVRQADAREARPRVGLGAVQPRELRDRERGDRHRAARVRPRVRSSSCLTQPLRVGRRLGVVPELGRPHDRRPRRRARPARAAARRPTIASTSRARPRSPRRCERVPPRVRILLAARRRRRRMRRAPVADAARRCRRRAPRPCVDCVDESTPSTNGIASRRYMAVGSARVRLRARRRADDRHRRLAVVLRRARRRRVPARRRRRRSTTVVPKRRGVGGIALHADGGIVVLGPRHRARARRRDTRTVLHVDGVAGLERPLHRRRRARVRGRAALRGVRSRTPRSCPASCGASTATGDRDRAVRRRRARQRRRARRPTSRRSTTRDTRAQRGDRAHAARERRRRRPPRHRHGGVRAPRRHGASTSTARSGSRSSARASAASRPTASSTAASRCPSTDDDEPVLRRHATSTSRPADHTRRPEAPRLRAPHTEVDVAGAPVPRASDPVRRSAPQVPRRKRSADAEQQLGDELVEALVAVAARRERVEVVRAAAQRGDRVGPVTVRRSSGSASRSTIASSSAAWISASAWKRCGLLAQDQVRAHAARGRSPTRRRPSSVRYACASKWRMPCHCASSSSFTR